MADKNLRYFMRPEAKEEKIVEVPGPSAIKGEDGKPITMKVKVLHNKRIREINDSYRTRRMATDKKGNPMVANGEVVFKVEKDSARAARHLIAWWTPFSPPPTSTPTSATSCWPLWA